MLPEQKICTSRWLSKGFVGGDFFWDLACLQTAEFFLHTWLIVWVWTEFQGKIISLGSERDLLLAWGMQPCCWEACCSGLIIPVWASPSPFFFFFTPHPTWAIFLYLQFWSCSTFCWVGSFNLETRLNLENIFLNVFFRSFGSPISLDFLKHLLAACWGFWIVSPGSLLLSRFFHFFSFVFSSLGRTYQTLFLIYLLIFSIIYL